MPVHTRLPLQAAIALFLISLPTAAQNAVVKPKITPPLFEKQKVIKATVHATGDAMLSAVTDGVAQTLLVQKITDADAAATFDLKTINEEARSAACWSPAVVTALNGVTLSDDNLKKLKDFNFDDATTKLLKDGTYSAALVAILTSKSASAAVLKLLAPSDTATVQLKRACRWPLDYAALAKDGLKKGMIIRLTDSTGATDEQVAAQTSPVSIFLHAPKEGDQVVKGEVIGDADKVRVEVYNSRSSVFDFKTASVDAAAAGQPSKSFTAGMNRRLVAGQTVRVMAFKADSEITATDYTLVETVGFDWGRVRAYFSAGATVATGEVAGTRNVTIAGTPAIPAIGNIPAVAATAATTAAVPEYSWKLNSADYFVALNLDYNWYSTLYDRSANPCAMPAKAREDLIELERWINQSDRRFSEMNYQQLNQYLESFKKVLKDIVATNLASLDGKLSECSKVEVERLRLLEALVETGAPDGKGQSLWAVVQLKVTILDLQLKVLKPDADRAQKLIREIERALADYRRQHFDTPPKGMLFNTSFEGRLGQAPVAGTIPDAASIVQSPNAGYLEVAAYLPMWSRAMAWRHADKENALFIAPLAKVSLLAAQDGPVLQANRPGLFKHIYPASHYGLRFGHFGLDARRKTVAPELISYLDFTVGRFDNFRRAVILKNPKDDPDAVTIPTRVEFSGRFKIPSTPLTIGFSANMGPGRDDLRIFFGTRFDIGRLLARALPITTQ